MAGFIDIACNFTHESFKHNLDEVLNNAEQEGVEKFVLLCASLADISPIKVIQNNAPEKYFISAGIHPHHATEILEINHDALLNKLKSISPNAIGETGLDYFRNISPPDIQKKSFGMHIEIAKEFSSPSSGKFINGVIDKLIKDLTEKGLIVKTGRGLIS